MRDRSISRHKALKTCEQAARWLHDLRSPETADHAAYLEWLLESPRHVEAFLRVSETDAALQGIDREHTLTVEQTNADHDTGNVVPLASETAPASMRRGERRDRRRTWILAASIGLVAIVAAAGWLARLDVRHGETEYVTEVGEQRVIALEDGSLLHMNTGSRVTVHYSARERRLELLEGEALFQVQKETARPFRVHSAGLVIQALGTQFNVQRGDHSSTVSVLEGRVRVVREDGRAPANRASPPELNAGEQIRMGSDGSVAEGAADIVRINAWRQRRLVFMGETLEAIAAEFNRYNRGLEIHIEPSAAGMRDYDALSFNADDPESFLAVLERDPALTVERRGNQVVVRRR